MFRIVLQTLAIATLVAGVSYFFFGARLQRLLVSEATDRQVKNICRALTAKVIAFDSLCKIPLPEIPELKQYYEKLKTKDGRWYQEHGWNYYPEVHCDGNNIKLVFMGEEFFCDGAKAVRVKEIN